MPTKKQQKNFWKHGIHPITGLADSQSSLVGGSGIVKCKSIYVPTKNGFKKV